MNKQQKNFHKATKHRKKREAKIRGGIQGNVEPASTFVDNRTVEEKVAGDVKLAKKPRLVNEQT